MAAGRRYLVWSWRGGRGPVRLWCRRFASGGESGGRHGPGGTEERAAW